MTIMYYIKNTGEKPTTQKGKVFVHFCKDKKYLKGGDFFPKTATTEWKKGFECIHTSKFR